MRAPKSVDGLTELGRVQLSDSFFMRDMLYSEVANFHGIPNIPDHPDLAIETGTRLCQELLEPLQRLFGKVSVRSAYRSPSVNGFCNDQQKLGRKGYGCASNEANFAGHIWDYRDADNLSGATATIVMNRLLPYFDKTGDWPSLAWWIHDHLAYSSLYFFPRYFAFNISWHEQPKRTIHSYVKPRECLTRPGMAGHSADHADLYSQLLKWNDRN